MKAKFYLFFISIVLFASCNVEKKIAHEFIQKNNLSAKATPSNLVLIFPDSLITTNAKLKQIPNFDQLETDVKEIVTRNQSVVLNLLSEQLFMDEFKNHLVYYLKIKGINVIVESNNKTINKDDSNTFVFNIIQMEAEESTKTMRNETLYNNYKYPAVMQEYYYEKKIDILNLNLWYKYSSITSDNNKVYYNSFSIASDYNSFFYLDKDILKFNYSIAPITLNDVYTLAKESAQKSADYIYNFLMNEYIKLHTGHNSSNFYIINSSGKLSIDPVGKRFLEVK